jgi:heat shock protein HtpX
MVATMAVLGIVYVAFIIALVLIGVPIWLVVLIVVGFAALQYFTSDKVAMYSMGAHEVTPEQAPRLHAVIDRLCSMADMPKPRVAVADTDVPNAFATGHSQSTALVCVTSGLLRRLEPSELEAVLAHELSHVAHRDVAVMTVAGFMGIVAGFLTQAGLRFMLFSGGARSREGAPIALIALAVVLLSAVVWALSFLLTRILSRYRELSADRAAAFLTQQPSALSSALTKITGDMGRIPSRDLRQAEPFNAFFFTPAFSRSGVSLSSLFATHPPLEQRLDQLAAISRQLGQGS